MGGSIIAGCVSLYTALMAVSVIVTIISVVLRLAQLKQR